MRVKASTWKVVTAVSVGLFILGFGRPGTRLAAEPAGATLTGQALFEGTPPKPQSIKMKADKACEEAHAGQKVYFDNLVINENKGIKWVFVSVKDVKGEFKVPAEPATFDQKGCMFTPHVFGVMVGQKIQVNNNDGFAHNVNCVAKFNKPFNETQEKGAKKEVVFTSPESMIGFRCDIHPWMGAYCAVVKHPFFAVTDENGQFTIKGLPAGEYTLKAWHEELGTQNATVTVAEGETKTVNFTFKPK